MAGNATGTNETSFSQQFSKTSWWQDEPSTISAQHKRGRCLIIHYTLLQTKRNASCWGESGCYSPGAVQMASAESARGVQPFHRLGREPPSVLYAFFLLGPMSLSVSCHCIRCTNHRREHSQEIESHTLIGLFPRKECMSVWSSRVGTGSVTWLRPERLRRRLRSFMQGHSNENSKNVMILNDITCAQNWTQVCQSIGQAVSEIFIFVFLFFLILFGWRSVEGSVGVVRGPVRR